MGVTRPLTGLGSPRINFMPTCRLVTLGCKVNQYETQYVKEALEINGYREAAEGERADLCVVNTCTVTMEGTPRAEPRSGACTSAIRTPYRRHGLLRDA